MVDRQLQNAQMGTVGSSTLSTFWFLYIIVLPPILSIILMCLSLHKSKVWPEVEHYAF